MKGHEAVANSSSSSVKSSSSCTDVFDENCSVTDAAKILNGYSSSSISGSILFENGKMTNDSAINVVRFDSSFADGWMKVAGYLSKSPYIYFFTDPSGFKMPVDISAWDGICMTYASNVNINVVAHDSRNEGVNEVYVTMSSKFEATTDNLVQSACVEWEDEAASLTNIDQIRLVPVSSSSTTQAVIYIKNISTVEKTDVAFGLKVGNVEAQSDVCQNCFIWYVKETINLNLFDSYTVTGDDCSNFDLAVINNKDSYLLGVEKTNQNVDVQIDDLKVCETKDGIIPNTESQCATTYGSLENPVLTGINGMACEGNILTVTFHPKSWYAAPATSSN